MTSYKIITVNANIRLHEDAEATVFVPAYLPMGTTHRFDLLFQPTTQKSIWWTQHAAQGRLKGLRNNQLSYYHIAALHVNEIWNVLRWGKLVKGSNSFIMRSHDVFQSSKLQAEGQVAASRHALPRTLTTVKQSIKRSFCLYTHQFKNKHYMWFPHSSFIVTT